MVVSSSDQPGSSVPCYNLDVTALVIGTSVNGQGEKVIESRLFITVTPTYPNFTLTCRNSDTGSTDSVIYHTIGR